MSSTLFSAKSIERRTLSLAALFLLVPLASGSAFAEDKPRSKDERPAAEQPASQSQGAQGQAATSPSGARPAQGQLSGRAPQRGVIGQTQAPMDAVRGGGLQSPAASGGPSLRVPQSSAGGAQGASSGARGGPVVNPSTAGSSRGGAVPAGSSSSSGASSSQSGPVVSPSSAGSSRGGVVPSSGSGSGSGGGVSSGASSSSQSGPVVSPSTAGSSRGGVVPPYVNGSSSGGGTSGASQPSSGSSRPSGSTGSSASQPSSGSSRPSGSSGSSASQPSSGSSRPSGSSGSGASQPSSGSSRPSGSSGSGASQPSHGSSSSSRGSSSSHSAPSRSSSYDAHHRPPSSTRAYEGSHSRAAPAYHTSDHRYGRPSARYVRAAPDARRPPPHSTAYRAHYTHWYVHPYYRYQYVTWSVVSFSFSVYPWTVTWTPPVRSGWVWVGGSYDRYGLWHPGYWSPVSRAPVYAGASYVYVPGWWQGSVYVEGYYRRASRAGWEWQDGVYYSDGSYVPGHWQPADAAPAGYTWEPGFFDGETWVEGFWRPEYRGGYTWVNGYFDGDGIYQAGYWMPVQDRAGYTWIPGWFDGHTWVDGYWVSEAEFQNADPGAWSAPDGWDDGWQDSSARSFAPSGDSDEAPLALPVEG